MNVRRWIGHQVAPAYPRTFGYYDADYKYVERRFRGSYAGLRAIQFGYALETRAQARDNGMPDQWRIELNLGPVDLIIDGPEHYEEES